MEKVENAEDKIYFELENKLLDSFKNAEKSDDKFNSMREPDLPPLSLNHDQQVDQKNHSKQLSIENSIYSLTFTSMISDVRIHFKLDGFINDSFFKSTMVFFIQMTIILLIGIAAYKNTDGLQYQKPEPTYMALRLLCCYLFHLSNYTDLSDSYRRLKFLVNNPHKFNQKHWLPAFLIT